MKNRKEKQHIVNYWLGILVIASLFFIPQITHGQEPTRIKVDETTIQKGYTIEHDSGNFRIAITSGQIDQAVTVVLKNVNEDIDNTLPQNKKAVSSFYTFDIHGFESNPIIVKKPSWLALKYSSENDYVDKAVYYWNNNKNSWIKLPSDVDTKTKEVRAITHLPFSRVVVLEEITTYQGKASWFASSHGLVAACNDFPFGTELRVVNLANNKSVKVKVISEGPYVAGRVIDLSDDAFKLLAPLGQGVIDVKVSKDNLNITAPAALVINAESGEVLWEKNSKEVRSVASLTKLMTALVFLDTKTSLDKVIAMEASDMVSGGKLYVKVGETLRVKDLFYSTLVGSANNAALALARSTGLSREEFVKRMNKKVKDLGLTTTHFIEPSGLDPANRSTAYDLALLSREALKSFIMLQGTTTKEYTFTTINKGVFHRIKNTNNLLNSDLYITGGKTGYLDEASYCLMTKARNEEGDEVIAVVLGAATSDKRFDETKQLLVWGLENI